MGAIKAKWKYGTPEWEAELARLEAANPNGFCWHCAGLLDYDGDWGAHVPTEAEREEWRREQGSRFDKGNG